MQFITCRSFNYELHVQGGSLKRIIEYYIYTRYIDGVLVVDNFTSSIATKSTVLNSVLVICNFLQRIIL